MAQTYTPLEVEKRGDSLNVQPWQRFDAQDAKISDDPRLPCLGQVADPRVRDLADRLMERDPPSHISMSMCVGPCISYVIVAALLNLVTAAAMFAIGCCTVRCRDEMLDETHHSYPMFIWALFFPLAAAHLYGEWVCLRLSCIPYVQAVKRFKAMGVSVGFPLWSAMGFAVSVIHLISIATNSLFAAMWFECSETAVDQEWSHTLRHSTFLHSFSSVTLHHAILFSWSVTFLDVLYPLLVSLPKYGQQALCKDVAETPEEGSILYFRNMFGTGLTLGHLFVAMGESAGMGTVFAQNPNYAAVRAEMSWDDLLLSAQAGKRESESLCSAPRTSISMACLPSCHGQEALSRESSKDQMSSILAQKLALYYQHVDGVFPIAFTRLGLRGLLKHTLQVNVQITMLGIALSSATEKGHRDAAVSPLSLVSIILCFVGACPLFFSAVSVLQFASKAPSRLESFYKDPAVVDGGLSEAQKPAVSSLRRKLCLVGVLLALLVCGQVYAFTKLIMIMYVCQQHGLWNLPLSWNLEQGCVMPFHSH